MSDIKVGDYCTWDDSQFGGYVEKFNSAGNPVFYFASDYMEDGELVVNLEDIKTVNGHPITDSQGVI